MNILRGYVFGFCILFKFVSDMFICIFKLWYNVLFVCIFEIENWLICSSFMNMCDVIIKLKFDSVWMDFYYEIEKYE